MSQSVLIRLWVNNMLSHHLKIEPRLEPSVSWQLFSVLIAVAMSVVVCTIMLSLADADISKAYHAIYKGSFGSWKATLETLIKATPLMLTGVAVTVAFRAKIWNIGAEGQLFAGAMMAYWCYTLFGNLPSAILVPMVFFSSFLGGALFGGLAGFLRSKYQVNEVLSTVMLNYVIRYFLSFMLVEGPWREQSSFYQQTPKIAENAHLPLLIADSRLHIGFLIAILVAIAVYVLLKKTSLGYEIRAIGENSVAAGFKGIDVHRTIILVMLISGGIAGLAGAIEVFGLHHRLRPDVSTGFGFTGIIIAMLAGLHPLGVIVAAILFGALVTGGIRMQIFTGVPSAMITAVEAIVLLFFLTAAVLARYEFKLVKNGE